MIPETCKMSKNKYGHVAFLIFFSSAFSVSLQVIARKTIKQSSDSYWNFFKTAKIFVCNSDQNIFNSTFESLDYRTARIWKIILDGEKNVIFVEKISKIETNLLSYWKLNISYWYLNGFDAI